jgi:uncharacterized protein DUF1592/uncharacterized protein DUF1588/uncharacterized protein DUF1587/uncharacterized protein DUF1585/uncharacterized protein DUF1595
MNRRLLASIVTAGAVLTTGGYLWQRHALPTPEQQWGLLERYCVTCHNEVELAGELGFDRMRIENLHADAKVWETVVRKIDGHLMPPPGEPRPDDAQLASFVGWLETSLDDAARAVPNPGAPVLHRLNRAEYANAIRDLLEMPVDAATLLPADDSSGGFDNIANALSVSPALLQGYVSAAQKISRLAIGDPTASAQITTYRAPRGLIQADHLEGQPLGTRGGMQIEHVFPLDAQYEIRVGRGGGGFGLETVGADEQVEITLNGARAAMLGGRTRSATLAIPAGPQKLGVAIVRKRNAQGVDDLFAVLASSPGIGTVSIVGPLSSSGAGDTPSRRRVFVCTPASAADEPACAAQILKTLARRAYRRPIADDDPALATLMEFYSAAGDFETGIQHALARVLVDPQFTFRFETERADLPPGAVYALADVELASRLSFFVWSSIPDEELLAAAERGELREPAALEQQVRRMLASPKADALVENFASQWLLLRQLDTASPSSNDFDGNLRQAFRKETELLFTSIVREDRSVIDLLDADYTFVDERLARHYGIPNIRGSRFRRVTLPNDLRRGLLGHGSILTVTSAPNRTSPVRRGQWVLQNVLGSPVPPPPEGVETNLDETAPAGASTTMRERLERHMSDPGCAACHNLMDPIGFALENFDFIGRWRDADGAAAVDPRGELFDGTELDGPASLRRALLAHREQLATTVTEKLLTYALGRTVDYYDMPAVRAIVRGAAQDDYRFSALVLGVASSVPFRMKIKAAPRAEAQASVVVPR